MSYAHDPLISPGYHSWFNRGFAVVRRGWRPLALVQLIVALPALALLIPGQLITDLATYDLMADLGTDADPAFGEFFAAAGTAAVALSLAALLYAVGTLVCARLVVAIATGGEARVGQAFRRALPRVPALIGWSLLGSLITVGAILACVLPVFYVLAVLAILPVVVLFERGNPIGRCFRLFHHDFGAAVSRIATIAGLGLAVVMVFGMISFLVSIVSGATSFTEDVTSGVVTTAVVVDSVAASVLNGIATLITGVVLTPLLVLTYADLRARHEQFTSADLT